MINDSFFTDKTILVPGGTGSIGSAVVNYLIKTKAKSIIVFSRDEYKQHKLKYQYPKEKRIKYVIGDIRDFDSINDIASGVDMMFHCAALKHVPIGEEMPEEFIKTNILGSINVKRAAIKNNIPLVVSISSDKAVYPANLMGLTKAVQEKVMTTHDVLGRGTKNKFINVRFGNVIGTHGSLFPILHQQISKDIPLTLTDPRMNRFFMSPEEAVELILWSAQNAKNGDTVVRKMRSVFIKDLMEVMIKMLGKPKSYPIEEVGIRVGEKFDEELITDTEIYRLREKDDYYMVGPYSNQNLEVNTMPSPKKKYDLKEFSSSHEKNLMKPKEIEKIVKYYLDKHLDNQTNWI